MKIKLHGILAHKFKKEILFPFQIDREFVFDALNVNFPQFRFFIQKQAQTGIFYELIKKENEYNIVPIICGNIGAVFNFIASTLTQGALGFVTSFAIGGITNLISPQDEESYGGVEEAVVLQSTRFQNLENKEEQGSKVPVGYGRLRVGSKLIIQYTEPVNWSEERLDNRSRIFDEPTTTYLNPAL
jgi:predicted phage tail protein